MKRLFLDTNVMVDLICHREPFFHEAKRLFALAYTNRISIGISALSYINTVYIAKKYGFYTKEVIARRRLEPGRRKYHHSAACQDALSA